MTAKGLADVAVIKMLDCGVRRSLGNLIYTRFKTHVTVKHKTNFFL